MDMPISVIITLFVAIVVGVAIIGFSSDILTDARDDIGNIGNEEDEDFQDNIVEVSTITESRIESLSEQCIRDSSAMEKEVCFVIRGEEIEDLSGLEGKTLNILGVEWDLEVEENINSRTVFIEYNPLRNTVQIIS